MRKFLLCSLLMLTGSLLAGSVNLINDSSWQLRAVIRGSDGSYLGEMIINSQQKITWNGDVQGVVDTTQVTTPYTVTWSCTRGGDFSVNTDVSPGSTVTAMTGQGVLYCQPPPAAPPPVNGPNAEEHLGQPPPPPSDVYPTG